MSVFHQLEWAALWDAMALARKQEESLPESMHLLGHFRDRYENSHSGVLASLLRPHSRHPKSAEFLELFLKQAGFEDIAVPQDGEGVQVLREHGRIDLLILLPNTSIIIENKLDAVDQPAQLARYYRFVREGLKVPPQNIRMLYLSIDGKPPTDQSIGENGENYAEEFKAIKNLKTIGHFKCISYKKDIYEWLQKIYENIKKDNNFLETKGRLFSAVDQYLYNVEVITGQTKGDNIMLEKITESLQKWESDKKSNDVLDLYNNVLNTLPHLIFYHEFKIIEEKLKQDGYSPVYFSYLQKIKETELLAEIQKGQNVGIGILVSSIPQCGQSDLKKTYIVYELLSNRESLQFGLTTANLETPEFQIGTVLDTMLEENEYLKNDGIWHFIFRAKHSGYPMGKLPAIMSEWFRDLHNYLSEKP